VIELERDGVRWKLQPDFAPLLDKLLQSPGETVKESPVKRVSRHRVGETIFYIKRYLHHAVPLRSLKFFFKPTQARQEWDLAQQLEARKIPIVRHVALGERWSWRGVEESILVTENFDGVEVEQCTGVDPLAVLKFVEQMHERGVVQEDLHLANLLVRKNPFELRLVDLHGTRVEDRLSPEDRRKNLALLRVFMEIPVTPEIAQLSRRLRRDKLFERSRRCLRTNRDFSRVLAGGLSWQVRGAFRSPAVDGIIEDPDGFFANTGQDSEAWTQRHGGPGRRAGVEAIQLSGRAEPAEGFVPALPRPTGVPQRLSSGTGRHTHGAIHRHSRSNHRRAAGPKPSAHGGDSWCCRFAGLPAFNADGGDQFDPAGCRADRQAA